MERQLEEMRERTAASSAALRALAAQGEDVEALVHRKRSLKPLVADLSAEAEALTGRLKDSSAVVQRVVESVRVLDTAQANTRRALERTVDIVGLKNCAEEVAASMQAQDWEKAADAMHRHLSDVQAEGGGSAGEEVAMKALRRALGELQTLMRERCEAAAASGDDASLQRCVCVCVRARDRACVRACVCVCAGAGACASRACRRKKEREEEEEGGREGGSESERERARACILCVCADMRIPAHECTHNTCICATGLRQS